MTFTQPRHLIAAGLIAAVIAYLGVQIGYGSLQSIPTLAGATLLLVASVDAVFALTMGPRVRRQEGVERVDALTAARAVALAKASSMAGAIMGGVWLGFLAFLLPIQSTVEAANEDTVAAVVGLVSALVLIGAGLWLEHVLRNPDEPDELDDPEES